MYAIASQKKYLVVIAGPTGIGKTALAIQLARHYDSVILSADSRQFYKRMDIGTAKPNPGELAEVKHYFIDNKELDELYGAGHFEKDVTELLGTLFEQTNIVFMVGGSGLYVNAVLNGVDDFMEVPTEIRESLNENFKKQGIEWLQNKLKELDPDYYKQVDLNNPQRLIRALEVSIHTGLPYSSFLNKHKKERNFIPIPILINTQRENLYKKINNRVDRMMREGLLEEVKRLEPYRHLNALKTVGYRELYEYLDGNISLSEAVEKIKQHTRNYAKRQITWFKNQGEFEEFGPEDAEKIKAYIDIILTHG